MQWLMWGLLWQGRVIKGEAGIRRSRYQEDVLINNHTSVRTNHHHKHLRTGRV